MIPNLRSQILQVSVTVVICLTSQVLRAEDLPVWDPPRLTRLSDLVVVGRLTKDNQVHVQQVLKGKCSEKRLSVPSLGEFAEQGHFVPSSSNVKLSNEIVVFLSQRTHPPRIVANGVYRRGEAKAKGGVLGYWQPMNPGGYVLKPKIQFKSIASVKALIQEELKAIPDRQKAALDKVKAATRSDAFRQALHELERITRIGDMDILKQVAALEPNNTTRRVGNIVSFIRNVKDPRAAALLEGLYNKNHDVSILYALGRLGNPDSLEYFESLIDKKLVPEPIFALYGIKELYLALEARGDQKTCDAIRDSMYRRVDKDLVDLIGSAPQLISVIPHQGSIDRLQRAYEHHADQRTNAEYAIESHIKKCKEKIARLQKRNGIARPSVPAATSKPRR